MMDGKRLGLGLAAGMLLALAVVTVSGGLGSTPLASWAPAENAASTTTVATSTVATSTATFTETATSTMSITSTTSASPGSLVSNVTYPSSGGSSSTTVTSTARSVFSSTTSSNPANQSAGTSANGGTPYYNLGPAGTTKPTQLASIAQQPIVSNAEIFVPVLVAFLLGAFLYRVAVQERERPSGD